MNDYPLSSVFTFAFNGVNFNLFNQFIQQSVFALFRFLKGL